MNTEEDANGGFDMPHDFREAILSAAPGTVWRGDGVVVVNDLRVWSDKERNPQTNAEKVRTFYEATTEGEIPSSPIVPSLDTIRLRERLIIEEYMEVITPMSKLLGRKFHGEELTTADIAPLMHELADLLYVTYGAILAFGVDPDPVFAEVHEANMRKLAGPRREDGKILKPEGWEPADVAAVIERLKGGA